MKWSWKTGRLTKLYPKPLKGDENGAAPACTDQFEAKVASEALRGEKTVLRIRDQSRGHISRGTEIAAKHLAHPIQVRMWKRQAVDGMADMCAPQRSTQAEGEELHARIGVNM